VSVSVRLSSLYSFVKYNDNLGNLVLNLLLAVSGCKMTEGCSA
jgi:hypothetical protein